MCPPRGVKRPLYQLPQPSRFPMWVNSHVVISTKIGDKTERSPQGMGPHFPHIRRFPWDAVQSQYAILACVVVTQSRPSYASFDLLLPIFSMSSMMVLWQSFVRNFSVLTPLLDAGGAGTFGQLPQSFIPKQLPVSKWVAFKKWGPFGMGSFPRLLIWGYLSPSIPRICYWKKEN